MNWIWIKEFLEHASGFSNDALHVVFGVCGQLLMAVVLRTSLARPLPWLIVLALEIGNEWNDIRLEVWPETSLQWGESGKDVFLTMFLPTLLLLIARFRPQILRSGRK